MNHPLLMRRQSTRFFYTKRAFPAMAAGGPGKVAASRLVLIYN